MGKYNKNMESPENIMFTNINNNYNLNNNINKNNTIEQQLFSSSPPPNINIKNNINSNNPLNSFTKISSFPTQYIQHQMFNKGNNTYYSQINENNFNHNFQNINYNNNRPLTTFQSNNIINKNYFDNSNNINSMNNTNYFNNNNNIQQINQTNLNIEELFEKYVNDCQNLISEYEKKMENYIFNPSLNNDNNDLILNLINEKNTVNNKIQNGQEEIKNCLGFYPDLTEFNSKISKYLNLVLDKKIKEIQDKRQNYNNKKQMNNNFINNKSSNKKNNNMNDNKLRNNSNNNFNNSQNKNSILNSLTQSQLNKKIKECQYRSKYEDLRKSIFKNEDINKDLMQSLSGWSKFITPKNNINMSNNNFYQTWKDNNSNVSSNIKSDKNEEKKSIEYNIPDDEFLMSEKNDNYNNNSISNSNSKQNKNNNILNNNINNNRKTNSSKNNNIHN